jgi:hypothetical protein
MQLQQTAASMVKSVSYETPLAGAYSAREHLVPYCFSRPLAISDLAVVVVVVVVVVVAAAAAAVLQ